MRARQEEAQFRALRERRHEVSMAFAEIFILAQQAFAALSLANAHAGLPQPPTLMNSQSFEMWLRGEEKRRDREIARQLRG